MATNNQISVEIPESVITEVNSKLKEIKTALAPYLQALTADEVHSLYKMGDKSVATVQKIKDYVTSNPEFLPAYMDKNEFLKDVQVVSQLQPLFNLSQQIAQDLSDTITLAGSEAMTSGLLYYGTVKEAASKGVNTAKPIYEDLNQRFSKRTMKTDKPA